MGVAGAAARLVPSAAVATGGRLLWGVMHDPLWQPLVAASEAQIAAALDRALSGLDFMVSLDIYLNETTRHADVILPGQSPLEDFHYDLLGSSLDYDQSGTLRLGMRLQGRNPAIEQGRPIHFNINLEEDIPTLLASLQLTDKVNEIIKQRVQQRMLERQTAPQEQ